VIKQRLIRVLVYEGDPAWIQETIRRSAVKGSYSCDQGVIKEAVVGDFLEPVITLETLDLGNG